MKIKISNVDALTEAISIAEGHAQARTIIPEDIVRTITRVEHHLGIPSADMDGINITADPNAQVFPAVYRYTPESTHFIATYRVSTASWYVTAIYRAPCRHPAAAVQIDLTDIAHAAVIRRATSMSI